MALHLPPNPLSDLLVPEIDNDVIRTVLISCPHKPSGQAAVLIRWDNMGNIHSSKTERLLSQSSDIPNPHKITAFGMARRADSARVMDMPLADDYPAHLQSWIEETAWALGAGYMHRWSHPPCPEDNALLRHSFGINMYYLDDEPFTRGETSDWLRRRAANTGYWSWEINCAYRKSEGSSSLFWPLWRKHDPSLDDDGARRTPWPGWRPGKMATLLAAFEREDRDRYSLHLPCNMVTQRVCSRTTGRNKGRADRDREAHGVTPCIDPLLAIERLNASAGLAAHDIRAKLWRRGRMLRIYLNNASGKSMGYVTLGRNHARLWDAAPDFATIVLPLLEDRHG